MSLHFFPSKRRKKGIHEAKQKRWREMFNECELEGETRRTTITWLLCIFSLFHTLALHTTFIRLKLPIITYYPIERCWMWRVALEVSELNEFFHSEKSSCTSIGYECEAI